MAIRPDAPSNPIGVVDTPIQAPLSGSAVVGSANTQTPSTSVSSVAEAPITPRVGASIISETPLDVVPKTSTPAVVVAVVDGATQTKSLATPIGDAIKNVTSALGGGGGGGSASSDEAGVAEPKKPNYLVLGLLGVGA